MRAYRDGGTPSQVGNADGILRRWRGGAGASNRLSRPCLSFPAGQVPAPGATVRFDLTHLGPTVFLVGDPISLPLCPPSPCTLGATLNVVISAQTLSLNVPCHANLVGATFAVQGEGVGSPGGCADLAQVVTSITVDVTIRLVPRMRRPSMLRPRRREDALARTAVSTRWPPL
jgi:hypothetical protein